MLFAINSGFNECSFYFTIYDYHIQFYFLYDDRFLLLEFRPALDPFFEFVNLDDESDLILIDGFFYEV